MNNDGFKILDADYEMHLLLRIEFLEVGPLHRDCGFQRLFEDLCQKKLANFLTCAVADHTVFCVYNLVGEAQECDLPVFAIDIQLLRFGAEEICELPQKS